MYTTKFLREPQIKFLRGKTFDGYPYVISIETGRLLRDRGIVTGKILCADKECLNIPPLSVKSGLALEQALTSYYSDEVRDLVESFVKKDNAIARL